MLPLVDILTPNHVEVQWLCGVDTLTSLSDVFACCDDMHARGVATVVVTSVHFGELDADHLVLVASSLIRRSGTASGDSQGGGGTAPPPDRFTIRFPRLKETFYGTGDLTAAMLLACLHKSGNDLRQACEMALAIVQVSA